MLLHNTDGTIVTHDTNEETMTRQHQPLASLCAHHPCLRKCRKKGVDGRPASVMQVWQMRVAVSDAGVPRDEIRRMADAIGGNQVFHDLQTTDRAWTRNGGSRIIGPTGPAPSYTTPTRPAATR